MQLRNSVQGYGAVPMFLHWLTVALVVVAVGWSHRDRNQQLAALRLSS
jgi:cytochrome b561